MQVTAPKVTWIMPVRNGMPFLSETLASIESQNEASSEILVWDNGSTDGTVDELQKWIPARIPGKVVSDRPQPNLAKSLALLVKESRTTYCARIDADDICLPGRLAAQLEYMENHPEITLLGTQVVYIGPDGKDWVHQQTLPRTFSDIIHGLLHGCPVCHPTWMFRRDDILAVGNYDDGEPAREDVDLLMRLITSGRRVECLNQKLLRYRIHPKSFTQTNLREDPYMALIPLQSLSMRAESFLSLSRNEVERTLEQLKGFSLGQYFRIVSHLRTLDPSHGYTRILSRSFLNAVIALGGNKRPLQRAVLGALLALKSKQWDAFRNQCKIALLLALRRNRQTLQ
jgi:glycosyltransferase involved in cell wall biosynthesis